MYTIGYHYFSHGYFQQVTTTQTNLVRRGKSNTDRHGYDV
jgi:hypothetical protein